MLKKFIEDAMSQVFLISNGYYNPTRIVILCSFIDNCFDKEFKINKNYIKEYIYCYYIVNKEIAKYNPNLAIRFIPKYGINDFDEILDEELKDWDSNSKNHILKFDDEYIYLGFEINESIANNFKIIGNMLMEKYFNKKFIPPFILGEKELINDETLLPFGKSNFFYLAMEDMQYCPLCENANMDELYAVHILPSKYCTLEEQKDKNNSMLLCKSHAEDYINKKFYFDKRGFVKNISSSLVNEKMHIDLKLRKKKQRYLDLYMEKNNKNF